MEFGGDAGFQTRCLICLDRKQWSRYSVQHVQEAALSLALAFWRHLVGQIAGDGSFELAGADAPCGWGVRVCRGFF